MSATSVEAVVRYLKPEWKGRSEVPKIGSRETRRANTDLYDVTIANARSLQDAGELDVDTNGFILVSHRTAVRSFRDKAQIEGTYCDEIRELLLILTGADELFFLQHLIRTETPRSFNDAYSRYVHCDYSAETTHKLERRMFVERGGYSREDAERWEFAWYNTWQPIDPSVQQNPLTLIDARTLDDGDVVDYQYTGYGEGGGLASMPVHNSAHRFYYFPDMQTDEAIVSKQLDTRPDRSCQTPHTSFDDKRAPEDALGRRSIELRALCAFRPS